MWHSLLFFSFFFFSFWGNALKLIHLCHHCLHTSWIVSIFLGSSITILSLHNKLWQESVVTLVSTTRWYWWTYALLKNSNKYIKYKGATPVFLPYSFFSWLCESILYIELDFQYSNPKTPLCCSWSRAWSILENLSEIVLLKLDMVQGLRLWIELRLHGKRRKQCLQWFWICPVVPQTKDAALMVGEL